MRNLRIGSVTVLLGLVAGSLPSLPASAVYSPVPAKVPATSQAGSTQACGDLAADAAKLAAAGESGVATCTRTSVRQSTASGDASISTICGGTSTLNRNASCVIHDGILVIFLVPSGEVVGVVSYVIDTLTTLRHDSLRWSTSFHYRFTSVTGPGSATPYVTDTLIFAEPMCGGNCTITSGNQISGSAFPFQPWSATGHFSSPLAGDVWSSHSAFRYWFQNPFWANRRTTDRSAGPNAHRCDNRLSGLPAGCTYPSVRPVHEIGSLRYPTYAKHIRLAIAHRVADVLTRTTSPAIISANRNVACPESQPRPANYSCDEYPFASTLQGAANQPFGRTFLITGWQNPNWFDCQVRWLPRRGGAEYGGYSVCMVPVAENSGGGSDLGNFYYVNRVIDGDTFKVIVV